MREGRTEWLLFNKNNNSKQLSVKEMVQQGFS